MKTLTLMLTLLVATLGAWAQEIRVSGRVTSANTGNPAEGISVTIKGGAKGTSTSASGEYVLSAKKGDVLVFSGIGFGTRELTVSGETMDAVLQTTAGDLGEVVVVGYGTQKRLSTSGALVSLNNQALTRRQVSSASQALQGLAPGVTVQQQSGRPGADGASIVIRGQSSINGNNSPLFIVDGVAIGQGSFEQIDPNAIESITVLKDAASTAIYGNRGSAGVVLIKTKRASKKGISVSYNGFVSKQVATAIPDRVGAVDHMELSNVAEQNRTGNPSAFVFPQSLIDKYKTTPANNLDVIDTDWLDEVLTNNGIMQNHNVQLSAGGDNFSSFTSFTYMKQQGLIANNSFEKFDLRFNPEYKLGKMLTLNGVLAYTDNTTISPSTGSPEFIIRQAIGLPAIGGGKYGPGMYGTAAQANNRNPIAQAEATGTSTNRGNTLLTRVGFNFRPIKGLDVEAYWAREKRNPYVKTWVKNASVYQPNLSTQGYDKIADWPGTTSLGETWRDDYYTTYLGQATYNFKVGEKHNFKVLAGAQSELFTNYFFGASRTGFINPDQPYLNLGQAARDNNAGASELALAGFFARLNYNFNEKYFLELNGRRDGSSRFSQDLDKQWGNFFSASGAWIFTKEGFLDFTNNFLTVGKLRGSIGGVGNQNIGSNYAFDAFYGTSVYSNPNNGTSTYFGNVTTLGSALLEFANPELQWETSQQWNVGIDLTFKNRLTFTADYYLRTQKDQLLRRRLPASAGGLSDPFINAGNMENRGWEISLNYKERFGKWTVDVTGMLSDVKNEVTSLVEGTPFLGDGLRTAPGYAYNSYFGYKALGYFSDSNDIKNSPVQFGIPWNSGPATGPKPGDVKYADISGVDGKPDGKIDANDRAFLGNAFPRYEYSINLNLGYGNFDLNIFGQGVGERDNYLSGTGAVPFASNDFAASLLGHHKDYWRPDNQNALFPRLLPSGSGGNNFLLSDMWIKSAAYFRIKNINLGYRLPTEWLQKVKINSMRVYVSGQNLITFTKAWDGFDPEINNANAEFYPLMTTYTAGVNVTF